MKIQKVSKFTVNRELSESFSKVIGFGKINGLMIQGNNFGPEDTITVKARALNFTKTLLNRVPILLLAAYSDFLFGSNGRSSKFTVLELVDIFRNELTTPILDETQGSQAFNSLISNKYRPMVNSVAIPLGMLYLDSDYELDFTIDFGAIPSASSTHGGEFNVYHYLSEKSTAFEWKYNLSTDLERNINNCEMLFLCSRNMDGTEATRFTTVDGIQDLEIDITDKKYQYSGSLDGFVAASQLFGSYEGQISGDLVSLFRNDDGSPDNLYCKVEGDDADKVAYFIVTKIVETKEVAKGIRLEAQELGNKVSELERNDPERAQALKLAGQIGSSSEYQKIMG